MLAERVFTDGQKQLMLTVVRVIFFLSTHNKRVLVTRQKVLYLVYAYSGTKSYDRRDRPSH